MYHIVKYITPEFPTRKIAHANFIDPGTALLIGGGMNLLGGIGGSILGGKSQKDAAKKAAKIRLWMFNMMRQDLAPWRETGAWAIKELQGLLEAGPGEFEADPGYQFRKEEGIKGLERSAAARGNLLSGATAKAITDYSQNYASNEYQNWLNRFYQKLTPYMNVAQMGQGAAAQTGAGALSTGAGMSQNYLRGGQAESDKYMNIANVIGGTVQSGIGNWLYLDQMNKFNSALNNLTTQNQIPNWPGGVP